MIVIEVRNCSTAITLFATSIAMAVGCVYAARNLHDNLLNQTMRLPMAFFDTTPLGRIVNRFSRDVDVVDNILPQIMRIWIMMIFNVSLYTNLYYKNITFLFRFRHWPYL